jgi:hypothetical protein
MQPFVAPRTCARAGWAFLILLLVGAAGCGGPKLYPVNGKVVYPDNSPAKELAGYTVEFEAVDGKIDGKGVSAVGQIQTDGTFRMTTLKPNDGALPGRHRVLIAPPIPEGDTLNPPRIIDRRFHSYQTSGLEAKVEEKPTEVILTVTRVKK